MKKTLILSLLFLLFLPVARAAESRVLTPQGWVPEPVWTEEEQKAPIAKKLIRNTKGSSSFFIRLNGWEEPHTHRDHDLTVVILKGKAVLHYEVGGHEIREGDVQEIPRGTVHWVENKGKKAVLAYAVFSPPLEDMDYYPVKKT